MADQRATPFRLGHVDIETNDPIAKSRNLHATNAFEQEK